MTPSQAEDLACGFDDMGDWMHQIPAPFPTAAKAIGIPPCRPPTLYRQAGLVTPYSRDISIPSREQGEADMHRRDAIKRGGL